MRASHPLYDDGKIDIVTSMDKKELVSYLEKIDRALQNPSSLCVYGSAADIQTTVRRLPPPFGRDTLLLENLELFRQDIELWKTKQ